MINKVLFDLKELSDLSLSNLYTVLAGVSSVNF